MFPQALNICVAWLWGVRGGRKNPYVMSAASRRTQTTHDAYPYGGPLTIPARSYSVPFTGLFSMCLSHAVPPETQQAEVLAVGTIVRLSYRSKSCPTRIVLACRDTRAMMQLGDIAMESSSKTGADLQHAEGWYRRAAGGDPPQPDAIFQIARIYHEVRLQGQRESRQDEACLLGVRLVSTRCVVIAT